MNRRPRNQWTPVRRPMCPDASVPGPSMWSRFPPPRPGRPKEPAPSPRYLSMRHRGIHKTSWTQGLARSSGRRPIVQKRRVARPGPGSTTVGASAGSWSTTRQVSIQTQVGCGVSLNRLLVVPIHLSCAIRGDPYTCGWGDCARGHRSQTRSRRLNPALAAARLPGRVTATAAMGVQFLGVRCAAWQSEPHTDYPGDTAPDHDLTRPRRNFRRESLAGWDSTIGLHKRSLAGFP